MTASTLISGPDSVLNVLSTLETLPPEASGALVFGEEPKISGVVLLEHGRVCWAVATGLRQRLTDLLRTCSEPPIPRETMEKLFQECRAQGKPFGEALVAAGLMSSAALRLALLHHTAESLSAGEAWAETPHWVAHRARGYQSAYTFLPVELLAYASTISRGEARVASALKLLTAVAGPRDSAVFDQPGSTLLACHFEQSSTSGLRALRAAGTWAAESLGARSDDWASPNSILKFTLDRRGGTWLGWRNEGLTFVVHCRNREDFSEMMCSLNRAGLTSAVHSSVPLADLDDVSPTHRRSTAVQPA